MAMPDIRMAVWFFFFWEKQHQKLKYHFFFSFSGKTKIRNLNSLFSLSWKSNQNAILFSFQRKAIDYSPHGPTEGGGGVYYCYD